MVWRLRFAISSIPVKQSVKKAIQVADKAGIHFYFGAEQEFYLFTVSETGEATKTHMIMPDIWTLPRMTEVKTFDVKFVLL